jgi:hypothetical protein
MGRGENKNYLERPDYEIWLKRELWTLEEFSQLAYGYNPDPPEGDLEVIYALDDETQEYIRNLYEPCTELHRRAKMSIEVGLLELKKLGEYTYVGEPIIFIRWALRNGYELVKELVEYEANYCDEDKLSHSKPLSGRERRKQRDRLRKDDWRRQYRQLREKHPTKSDRWIAEQISRMDIAKGRAAETIRKHMVK